MSKIKTESKSNGITNGKEVRSSDLLCEKPVMALGDLAIRFTIFYKNHFHSGDYFIKEQDIIFHTPSTNDDKYADFLDIKKSEISSIVCANLNRLLNET